MGKLLNPELKIDRLIGKWRLFHGYCPRCNSDAPAVDKCSVCKQVHIDGENLTFKNIRHYPPNTATKALWWYSWVHPAFEKMQTKWFGDIGA